MITYTDIYECLRKERYSEQLQPLPKKFISEIADYLREKKKFLQQQEELSSEETTKIQKQVENTNSIFKELMLLRKKKLLGLVFVASETGISKRDFENMLDFEKEMFDGIMAYVQDSEKIISSKFNGNGHDRKSEEKESKLLLFLDDVPEFLGINGETLGPFKKDEISNIPKQIADILLSDKKAEVVIEE